MKAYKLAAKRYGYELWWDASLRLWCLTKEGVHTSYISSTHLKAMSIERFEISYLTNDFIGESC